MVVFFVEVGQAGAVKGRLPNNWGIIAEHDPYAETICIHSPDTRHVSIIIHTSDITNLSSSYQETSDIIDEKGSKVEVAYNEETGVLRYDSRDALDFWLEVNTKMILNAAQKTTKRKRGSPGPDPWKDLDDETVDDCIEELCNQECAKDLVDELQAGYDCTPKQAMYWLKHKYIDTTSHGEDLYDLLKTARSFGM